MGRAGLPKQPADGWLPPVRIAHLEGTIRGWIENQPDLTLAELCERLQGEGITIKSPALWHQLDKWGLSFKKNSARQRAASRGRAAVTS